MHVADHRGHKRAGDDEHLQNLHSERRAEVVIAEDDAPAQPSRSPRQPAHPPSEEQLRRYYDDAFIDAALATAAASVQ